VAKEGMKAGFTMKQSNQYLILTKEQTRSLGEAYAHLNNLRHSVFPVVNDETIPTPQINEYENIYE
jgi:hypothetical protein